QETEVHCQAYESLRGRAPLVDPLPRVVAFDVGGGLPRGTAVEIADLLDRGHAGLDIPPLRGQRGPGPAQEQRREQNGAHHQKPIGAPSARGSAPPRSVPLRSVMPCPWPMRLNQSDTAITRCPRRASAARTCVCTRLSMRTASLTSPGVRGPHTKRGRSMASWISMP